MVDKVEYIASIFKIDVNNQYVILDIAEELKRIDSFDHFRNWLKVNLNHYDAQYLKPYEKFIFLIRMYLKNRVESLNSERISKSRVHAFELAKKVKLVSPFVEDRGLDCKNFKTPTGEKFFSTFDVSQIDKVGGLLAAVRLQKSVSGSDALIEKLLELSHDLIVNNIIEFKSEEKQCDQIRDRLENITRKM